MGNRILAIVVTYYPQKDILEKNISAFVDDVEKVLVWENSKDEDREKYRYIIHPKVEYCGDGVNSISHALNFAWRYAKSNGYDYLLTMDQDSIWEDFTSFVSKTTNNLKIQKGIFGPNAYYPFKNETVECDHIITSGMLLKTETIDEIGGWNEAFFIDCVDDEFCLRAKSKGIKSFFLGDCMLHHTFGTPGEVRFMGRSFTLRNDSPQRLYSIYKSHVLLTRMFPENKIVRKELFRFWFPLIKWTFLLEDQKAAKLYSTLKGIVQGLLCNLSVVK